MKRGAEVQRLENDLKGLKQETEHLCRGYESLSQRLIGLRMLQHIAHGLT